MQHIAPNSCGTAVPRQARCRRPCGCLPEERGIPRIRAVRGERPGPAGGAAAPGAPPSRAPRRAAAASPRSSGKGRWAARLECGGSGLRITCSGGGAGSSASPPPPVNRIPLPAAGTGSRAALSTCCRRTGTRTPLAARAGLGPPAPSPSHLPQPQPGAARPRTSRRQPAGSDRRRPPGHREQRPAGGQTRGSHGRGGRGRGRDPVPANCKRRVCLPHLRAVAGRRGGPGLRGRRPDRPGREPGGRRSERAPEPRPSAPGSVWPRGRAGG